MCTYHSLTHRRNLQVRDGDVEELVHVGVPDHADVGDDGCAEVALVAGQVPDTVDHAYDGLLREDAELLLGQDGPAKLQVAVHLGGGVGPG